MNRGLLRSFFPPPKFLEPQVVGVDISDQSIKFVSLKEDGSNLKVDYFGERDIPSGVISAGQIKDKEKLKGILSELKNQYGFLYVFASLPEEESYTFRLRLPFMKSEELLGSIELQIEEYIPLAAEDTVFDYEVFHEPHDKHDFYDVVVYAIAKQTAMAYLDVFHNAGIIPLAFEIEAQSLARAVVSKDKEGTILMVDVGKTRSGFAISSRGVITFASTVGVGGNDFTTAIKKNLNISFEEAEKIKVQKAIIRTTDNSPLFFALIPVISVLRDEILKRYSYWNSYQGREEKAEDVHFLDKISEVILTGGQSLLPGLDRYLGEGLDVSVSFGDPWLNILDTKETVPPINKKDSLKYIVAIGLAMRRFESN